MTEKRDFLTLYSADPRERGRDKIWPPACCGCVHVEAVIKKRQHQESDAASFSYLTFCLFCDLGFQELAVEAGDVADGDTLGTFSLACTGVGTVAETEFVHFFHHGACAACAFHLTLGKESELADLG